MMIAILLAGTWTCLIGLVLIMLGLETLAACLARTASPPDATKPRPRLVVLIPAHNEERGLSRTLEGVVKQLLPQDRCIVVADNCDDGTAEVAARFPVEVIRRHDSTKRGKGYALECGVERMRADPPDEVIFIDADCHVEPGALEALAREVAVSGRPIQGGNLLEPPLESGLRDRVSSFAFFFKNHVRPLGLGQLGGSTPLLGTGMAMPWSVLNTLKLGSANTVEDLQLGVDLAIKGYPPRYLPIPCVQGRLPAAGALALTQRRRWEQGHVRTLVTQAPRLLFQSIKQFRRDLLLQALDLAVPPLSLLVLLTLFTLALQLLLYWFTDSVIGLLILGGAAAFCLLGCMAAWRTFGQSRLSIGDIARIPWYVAWKVPIYAGLLFKPQRDWISLNRWHSK